MFKQICVSTIMVGSFMLTSALAENNSERTAKDSSSRGSVTQGVIGAEAKENRKLVPEQPAAEIKEQDSSSNIRLPKEITDDIDSTSP